MDQGEKPTPTPRFENTWNMHGSNISLLAHHDQTSLCERMLLPALGVLAADTRVAAMLANPPHAIKHTYESWAQVPLPHARTQCTAL